MDALRRLEDQGILRHCGMLVIDMMPLGSDKQGVQHYLIFGIRYPRDDDIEKGIIKNDIFDCLNYVS